MENISKIVVCLETGKKVGYVLDVALDLQALRKIGYYVVDEESEGVFLLKDENLREKGVDALLIDNVATLEFCAAPPKSLLGKKVLSQKGEDFGHVEKFCFFRKKLAKIITDKCEILARFISLVGEDVLFVSFGRKRIAKKSIAPLAEKEEMEDASVRILNLPKTTLEKPEKVSLSMQYYLGKVCDEDVFGQNNERVAAKGEKITKAVFEKAKKHNRINQLFFSIKRES